MAAPASPPLTASPRPTTRRTRPPAATTTTPSSPSVAPPTANPDTKGGPSSRTGASATAPSVFCGDISTPPTPGTPKPAPGDKPRPRDGWRCATKDGKTIDALHADLPCNQLTIAFGNG